MFGVLTGPFKGRLWSFNSILHQVVITEAILSQKSKLSVCEECMVMSSSYTHTHHDGPPQITCCHSDTHRQNKNTL